LNRSDWPNSGFSASSLTGGKRVASVGRGQQSVARSTTSSASSTGKTAKPGGSKTASKSGAASKKTASKSTASKSTAKSSSGNHSSQTTIDREEIRRWAEERGGKPACVQGTGGKDDVGLLRLEFPGKPGANDDKLQEIDWDEFFEKFDERNLALVYQEQTAAGKQSNFNKLVDRETVKGSKTKAAG